MRFLAILCVCLAPTQLAAFPQSSIRIAGVEEPPELMGEPKTFTPPSETTKQFDEALPKDYKNVEQVKAGRDKFTTLLQQNPDYSDAYFMRAMLNRCLLNSNDIDNILKDINTAISTHDTQRFPEEHKSLADLYSFRAKVVFDTGHYQEAMNDLEKAVKQGIDDAASIFFSSGTKPDAPPSGTCAWSLSDLDILVRKFPKDYRGPLLRGLYYRHFVTFDVKYFSVALDNIRGATAENPRSALSYYQLGRTYSNGAMWPSLLGISQEQSYTKAIQAYDKAIELDPAMCPAFLQRANSQYALQHYREAIRDFDKVVELDPQNLAAYADRGLAKSQLGQYRAAILDFDEVIRKAKPNYGWLESTYEKRASAYFKLGNYAEAIDDLTKAIKLELGNQIFMCSIDQFRSLYPEYDSVSDEVLYRKLNKLFWAEYDYSAFAASIAKNKGDWAISELNELYEQRGDAYLRTGEFRKAVNDFNRILRAIPLFATGLGRWRSVGSSREGEQYYIDVKTVEFSHTDPARLWLKTVNKDETNTVQSYEIDCKARRLNVTSTILYGPADEVVSSSESSTGWQRIVPETQGEQLYNGMCSGVH